MASQLTKKLAKRLKELREERGLTQWEAARKCRMEYKYYQRYEGKEPRDMRLSTLERVARAFDINPSDLIDFD